MKKRITLFLLITFMSLFPGTQTRGQIIRTRLDIPVGIAYPEFLHLGIRYQYSDMAQIGLYYGGDSHLKPEIINTYTFDHMVHFGRVSYHSNRGVWYARQGYTYSMITEVDRIIHYSYINLGAGYDFPLNSHFGINVDMGFRLQVNEKREFKDSTRDPWYNTAWIWRYLVRLQLYYSF